MTPRPVHRLDRVVDEVDDDPANLLPVHPHQRQRVGEPLEPTSPKEAVIERQRFVEEPVQIGRHGARGAMRANCENSSTSPLSDSTSPTIVEVHSSTSAGVGRRCGKVAPQRSADS